MAEYWSTNDRGYRVRVYVEQLSRDIFTNTSQLRIQLTLFNQSGTFNNAKCSGYVAGSGHKLDYSGTVTMSSRNSEYQLFDKTITFNHRDDGSADFIFHCHFNGSGGSSPNNLEVSNQAFTLASIPRGSNISVKNGVIGNNLDITIDKQINSATHTLRYSWYGHDGKIADNINASYKWMVPETFANDIPTSASGWGTVFVDTYVNGKFIQTKSATFTASLSLLKAQPYFSGFVLADTNEKIRNITQSASHFVSVLSRIYARFENVKANYGAAITSYFMEIVGNNNTISAPNGTFREISVNKDTQFTLRGYVEDSRGFRSEVKETTFMVLNYFSPTLRFEVTRSGSTNSTLTIKRFAKIAPLTVNGVQKNSMKLTFTTRRIDSDTETIDNGGAGGTWSQISEFNASNGNLGNSYPADTSYIVAGKLEDKFTSVSFQAAVPTDKLIMSYDQQGVGIGKYRENGALDVNGLIYSDQKQIQHHKLTEPNGAAIDNKVANLNDYRTTGFYSILGNYKNHPALGEGAYLEVVESISGYHQTLTTVSGRTFKRTITSNSTGSWIEYTPKPEKQEPAMVKQEIDLGWDVKLSLARKGSIVTASINRSVYKVGVYENGKMETNSIPSGFRPAIPVHLVANKNVSTKHSDVAVWTFSPSGEIFLTNQSQEPAVYTGTVTYLTEDN